MLHGGFCDLEKNVLIKKTCRCQDILHCVCPDKEKYSVKITDFDYICECSPTPVNLLQTERCKWFNYCGGTLTYRSPEVSKNQVLGLVNLLKACKSWQMSFNTQLLDMHTVLYSCSPYNPPPPVPWAVHDEPPSFHIPNLPPWQTLVMVNFRRILVS